MIRELFFALAMLIITVAATAWLNSGPRLDVQQVQVEASLADWPVQKPSDAPH